MTKRKPEELISELATEEMEKQGKFVTTWGIERLGYELDFSLPETGAIVDLVIDDCPLTESLKISPHLQELMRCDPRVKLLMNMTFRIEEKVSGEKKETEFDAER